MTNEIKKEKIKKILAAIQESALSIVDKGLSDKHPMDIVMELTITAYELDLLTDFVNKSNNTSTSEVALDNVIKINSKDVH